MLIHKSIFTIFILAFTVSWGQTCEDDYYIANSLAHKLSLQELNLIKEPNNRNLTKYLNGFYELDISTFDTLDFEGEKFSYRKNPLNRWEAKTKYWEKAFKNRVNIINNFTEIKKVFDLKESKVYISLSNPAYSEDGNFAIINVDILSDYVVDEPESYVMIFKKNNTSWSYVGKFASALY